MFAAVDAIVDSSEGWDSIPDRLYADQLAGALTLALGPAVERKTPHSRKLVLRTKQLIADMAFNHYLDAAQIAKELNISVRYLQSVLAAENTSFGQELMRCRLEQAAQLLRDARFRDVPVSDIAWRAGFADPSHFHRRFRARYEKTPSAYRAAGG